MHTSEPTSVVTVKSLFHERDAFKLHTGVKPFKCDHCNRCFTRAGKLRIYDKVHTGRKPFKCSHCDKSFNRARGLRRYNEIHIGEKTLFKTSVVISVLGKKETWKIHRKKGSTTDVVIRAFSWKGNIHCDKPHTLIPKLSVLKVVAF